MKAAALKDHILDTGLQGIALLSVPMRAASSAGSTSHDSLVPPGNPSPAQALSSIAVSLFLLFNGFRQLTTMPGILVGLSKEICQPEGLGMVVNLLRGCRTG